MSSPFQQWICHFDDRAVWYIHFWGIYSSFSLIIIWLPLSTFWRRSKNSKKNRCILIEIAAKIQKKTNMMNSIVIARKVESNHCAFIHLQIWSLHTTPVKIIHALIFITARRNWTHISYFKFHISRYKAQSRRSNH